MLAAENFLGVVFCFSLDMRNCDELRSWYIDIAPSDGFEQSCWIVIDTLGIHLWRLGIHEHTSRKGNACKAEGVCYVVLTCPQGDDLGLVQVGLDQADELLSKIL